jgi:hypothetical protein
MSGLREGESGLGLSDGMRTWVAAFVAMHGLNRPEKN